MIRIVLSLPAVDGAIVVNKIAMLYTNLRARAVQLSAI